MKAQVSFSSFPGCHMADERSRIPANELARWLFVAVLIVAGIALYFRYAPRSEPIVTPTMQDANP